MPVIRKTTFTKGSELRVYENILIKINNKEISIREGARILNVPKSTFYDRINRLKRNGNLIHGNTGKIKHVSKLYERKEEIIKYCNDKYGRCNCSISHTAELLSSRDGISINKETLRRWILEYYEKNVDSNHIIINKEENKNDKDNIDSKDSNINNNNSNKINNNNKEYKEEEKEEENKKSNNNNNYKENKDNKENNVNNSNINNTNTNDNNHDDSKENNKENKDDKDNKDNKDDKEIENNKDNNNNENNNNNDCCYFYYYQNKKKKKLPKQRIRREPKPNFGELIQLDGSFDYWFNGTKTCLINMVDDATGISELHFDKEETIVSVCKTVWNWFLKYGTPKSFYVDGRNMYHLGVNSEHNFFTNMCKILNIKVILSKCPQGKGRVERENGVHQKRLIPLFELDNIKSIEEANRYLEEKYIDEHNSKFSHKPSEGNVHTKLLNGMTMDDIFYIETERRLNNDWTFSYNNRYYQIPKQSKYYPPSKSKIQIKVTINGTLIATYRDLEFKMNVDNDYIQDTSDIKRTKDDDIKKEDTVMRREV